MKSKTKQALEWLEQNPHLNIQRAAEKFDIRPGNLYVARKKYAETAHLRCPTCNQIVMDKK